MGFVMDVRLVSVVIPAYNAAQFIKQAIESVLTQTYRDFEIIVVDDGSTDNTPHIVQEYGKVIRYIRQPNRGLSAARNTAIRNARANVIALLDSDDLWEPQYLERMIGLLNIHPEAAGVYCGFQYIKTRGDHVGKPSLKTVPPDLFYTTMREEGNWLAPCAVIFRKNLAESVGLFDESLHAVEDWDMWIRLSEHQPFIGLPQALVKYRRHESNMSRDPERMIKATAQLMEKQYGAAAGNVSTWSQSKKKAYCDYYLGAAIRFVAAGMIPKSIDYLQKLIGVSPDYACSMFVWRGILRAQIPVEYQFDPLPPHDWTLIQAKLLDLLDELAQRADSSNDLARLYTRLKAFAFLALADEAGWAGEPGRAYGWLGMAVLTHPRLLFVRLFWGTLFRNVSALIPGSSKKSESEVVRT